MESLWYMYLHSLLSVSCKRQGGLMVSVLDSISSGLDPVVQTADNAIYRINHYPVDSIVCFVSIYPLATLQV